MEPRSARTVPLSHADSKCKNLHHDLCINRHNISLKIEYSCHMCQGPSDFKYEQTTLLQKSFGLEKNGFHTAEWELKKKNAELKIHCQSTRIQNRVKMYASTQAVFVCHSSPGLESFSSEYY